MNAPVVSESIATIVALIVQTLLTVSALVEVAPYVVYHANVLVRKPTSLTSITDALSSVLLTGKGAILCLSVCPFETAEVSVNVGSDHLCAYQCRL